MSTSKQYALVVPVKTLSRAKSRLQGFTDVVRRDLVRAFALDALTAALASPMIGGVHVVTDEPELAEAVRALGCAVLPDAGAGDLNTALRSAVASVSSAASVSGPDDLPVAAMLGDLPCLVTDDLTEALVSVRTAGFVADAAGTGTTLLAVRDNSGFDPRFGAGSRSAHRAAGVPEVLLDVASLRQDVDTAEDLDAAVALGVGAHTKAVLGLS